MDSKYPEAAKAELIDYMTLRAAAVANLHSNRDSIKLRSEEKESSWRIILRLSHARHIELFQNYAVKTFGRLSQPLRVLTLDRKFGSILGERNRLIASGTPLREEIGERV
jgi:hypothetical protein